MSRVPRGTRTAWAREHENQHQCRCGCGGYVIVRPTDYPTVPSFLWGHNRRGVITAPKPKPEPCACGCGGMATPGKRYISGHNSTGRRLSEAARKRLSATKLGALNPMFGIAPEKAGHYKGGVAISSGGYRLVLSPDHPFAAASGYVPEHRLVVERTLRAAGDYTHLVQVGRRWYLRPGMHVHHIDGDKLNNDPDNLAVLTPREHQAVHAGPRPKRSHCKRGHAFDEGNTYVASDGRRQCIECRRLRDRSRA